MSAEVRSFIFYHPSWNIFVGTMACEGSIILGIFLGILGRQWYSHMCLGAHCNIPAVCLGIFQRCRQILFPELFGRVWAECWMSVIILSCSCHDRHLPHLYFLVISSLSVVLFTSTCVRYVWTFPISGRRHRPALHCFSQVMRPLYMPSWFPHFL